MKTKPITIPILAALGAITGSTSAALWVDFNSNQDGGGTPVPGDPADPTNATHNSAGYSSYHAGHEVAADFITATYNTTFAITGPASVSLTPSWPNTADVRVQQSIDRAPANDANYTDFGFMNLDLNLVTDWIGIDTRTGSGGNGNFDGVSGTPTWLDLTLTGLPAQTYSWQSIHHDTENVFTNFNVYVDNGTGFVNVGAGYQNDSTPGGSPSSGTESAGPANTFSTTFVADGVNDVTVRFEPLSGAVADSVHNQLFAVNGFQLDQIPEPSGLVLLTLGCAGLVFRRRRSR